MGSASDFIIENGAVTKYIDPGGPVVTPAGIKSIADDAFQSCSSLERIALPDGVTYIGCRAF